MNVPPVDKAFQPLSSYPFGDAPSGRLFQTEAKKGNVKFLGPDVTITDTAGGTKNAKWFVWVERVTKTFGFVEPRTVNTGQYFISPKTYDEFMKEMVKNKQAVTIEYTYIFINQTAIRAIPQGNREQFQTDVGVFLGRLSTELDVSCATIINIDGYINSALDPKQTINRNPVEQLLLDVPDRTPLRLVP